MKNNISEKLLKAGFGLESVNTRKGKQAGAPTATSIGLAGWSVETEAVMTSLLTGGIVTSNDQGLMEPAMRKVNNANLASNGIQKLVNKYSQESALYRTLPQEIQDVTCTPAKALWDLQIKKQGCEDAGEAFKLNYKIKQAKAALESALWNVFAGFYQLKKNKTGFNGVSLEGQDLYKKVGTGLIPNMGWGQESTPIATYSDQIYIPKISAFNSWLNVASVIMPKVQKTKTVLSEVCEIPLSTKVMVAYEKDKNGKVINEWRREDLYAKMDMHETAPGLDKMRTRDLTISEAEFMQEIDLHITPLSANNNEPFLGMHEHIGPQLTIVSVTLDVDGTNTKVIEGEINDTRAGVSTSGPTLGQLDTKGKYVPVVLDKTKPDEIYHVTLDWDIQNDRIRFLVQPSKPAMKAMKAITLRANMRDIEQTLVSRIAFSIKEERTTLRTPEIDRYVLPIMEEEMDLLAEKGSTNHLNKLVELTSEFTQHKKESRWIKEYRQMKNSIKLLKGTPATGIDSKILYTSQKINLNTLSNYNKVESLAYHLGNNLSVLRDKFGKDANTNFGVQLSMFTGTLSLNAISFCLEHITGDIDENSNGQFMGVNQSDRVRSITIGNGKNTPVQSVVVGTDKADFDAIHYKNGAEVPQNEVEYVFEIIPTYADENINTTLFVEQPTKVISGSEIRANENQYLPAMIIHEGYKYNSIRGAAGDLTITGVGFNAF